MIKRLLSRIKEDDNPRLHRTPFLLIWIASYGMAWFALSIVAMILFALQSGTTLDVLIDWINNSSEWFKGLLTGLVFGLTLSLIQTWIIRQRYGFVPRFWRIATITGALVAGWAFPILSNTYNWYGGSIWINIGIWFLVIPLFQSLVLSRVSRYWWLMAWVGLCAALFSAGISLLQIAPEKSLNNAITPGLIIQVLGSGIVILRLIPLSGKEHIRKEIERPRLTSRTPLHPITFIAFWTFAQFMGWILLLSLKVFFEQFELAYTIGDWFRANNIEWIAIVIRGALVGLVISYSQKWLMQRQSTYHFRHWIVLSTIAYSLVMIVMFDFFRYSAGTNIDGWLALAIWFSVPAIMQSLSLWSTMRGGWIWIGTGIVTGIIAVLMNAQIGWQSMSVAHTIIFASSVHAILASSTYLLLLSQQNQRQPATA